MYSMSTDKPRISYCICLHVNFSLFFQLSLLPNATFLLIHVMTKIICTIENCVSVPFRARTYDSFGNNSSSDTSSVKIFPETLFSVDTLPVGQFVRRFSACPVWLDSVTPDYSWLGCIWLA